MYEKSLAIHEALGSNEGVATDYGNLGITYFRGYGDLDAAETLFKKSLSLSEPLNMKPLSARQCINLGIVYEQRGDMVKACAYWRKARELCAQIGATLMIESVESKLRDGNCPVAN